MGTACFNVRVDSGDFATLAVRGLPAGDEELRLIVSMSVWTLGTLLLTAITQNTTITDSLFQCPCGLWGLCYLSTAAAGWRQRFSFQCPCGLWGLCYAYLVFTVYVNRKGFQCPCGLWGLCYARRAARIQGGEMNSFNVRVDSGDFATRRREGRAR